MRWGRPVSANLSYWKWFLHDLHLVTGLPLHWPRLLRLTVVLVSALTLAGVVVLALRGHWFPALYGGASLVMICVTPWPAQFARYLTSQAPFLALFLVATLGAFLEGTRRCHGRAMRSAGLAGVVLVVGVVATIEAYAVLKTFAYHHTAVPARDSSGSQVLEKRFFYDLSWETYDAALEWLKDHRRADDVIATTAPHWAHLVTGARTVMVPMEADPEVAQRLLDSVPVDYLVLDTLEFTPKDTRLISRYAAAAVERHPNLWRQVFTAPGKRETIVYERLE